jgi:transposase
MRETSEAMNDLFGVPMSTGRVVTSCDRVSAALEPVYAEVKQSLPQQPVANGDETGWKQENQRHWLWTVVTPIATLFHINRSRGGQVWRTILGESYAGILGSDRLSAYNRHPITQRQLCWAHLKRNLRAIAERGGAEGAWAGDMLAWLRKVFLFWHAFREGRMNRVALERELEPIKDELWTWLLRGKDGSWPKVRALSEELMHRWDGLWVFVTVEGVEPTNNAAEQALRPAVLWRKGCFGTQSDAGSRFVERMLTVRETCRQQGRAFCAFITEAVTAHQARTSVPSLLVTP